jgi:excisionase family DNA binding protein
MLMIPKTSTALPEAYLSVGALAQELGVARQRIHRMVQSGEIHAVRVGPHRLIPREEAERLIASSKRVARPDGRSMVVFNPPATQTARAKRKMRV